MIYLGILGADKVGADKLRAALEAANAEDSVWDWRDHSATGADLLAASGVDADRLRTVASGVGAEFSDLQSELSAALPGSLYVLGVLSDDVFAAYGELWLLPTAPGPAVPDRIRVPLEDDEEIVGLVASALAPTARLRRPYLGAVLIDSALASGPVVFSVAPGSPAAGAGVRVGDVLVGVDDARVDSAAGLRDLLATLDSQTVVGLRLIRGRSETTVAVRPVLEPQILEPGASDLSFAALWAALASADRAAALGLPDWALELNRAVVLMRGGDWAGAVPLLRIGLEGVPAGHPVGAATARYLLAVALTALGPDYYSRAREMLEAVVQDHEARLFHGDGEPVWPRAWARLELLRR